MDPEQFNARIEQIYGDLDQYSYYELLNLTPQASPDQIRSAFHRMALSIHPDRHQQHEDQILRKKIYTIYKRMTEGYRVLMEPKDRRAYDADLQQGQMRLVRTQRKGAVLKRQEDAIDHPKAKQFFTLGLDAERRGDLKGAKLNYKFALDLAPDHPVIKAAMDKLEQQAEEQ